LVNILIKYHPTIGDIISNKYLKVVFYIPTFWDIYQDTTSEVDPKNPKIVSTQLKDYP
jgi:hypothetical protein